MDKKTIITDLKKSREIKNPVIYGICGVKGNKIIYVGQTKNLYRRLEHYLYKPHNKALVEWMKNNKWGLAILEENPQDINKSEIAWIKKLGMQNLFNMVGGGDQNWRHHDRKPWMAKQGIKCPSDMIILFLINRNLTARERIKKKFGAIRAKMTDTQRTLFEVAVAKDFYNYTDGTMGRKIDEWLSFSEDRIIKCLKQAV